MKKNFSDEIISDTPALDGGETRAMLFSGQITNISGAYKMKKNTVMYYVRAVQEWIRHRGCPEGFIGDCHPDYKSEGWYGMLRDFYLSWWQSEPYMKQQQGGERRWKPFSVWLTPPWIDLEQTLDSGFTA